MNILADVAKQIADANDLKRISFVDSENATAVKLVTLKMSDGFQHIVVYNTSIVANGHEEATVLNLFIQMAKVELNMQGGGI